jgi:hypothetical protein
MISHVIDFRENVDYSLIQNRDIISLDMNIWIELADGKTVFAQTIKELLQLLVKDGKLFCPSIWSVLSELYKQSYSSRLRVGKLMDELSLNYSFAPSKEIWREEVRLFVQTLVDEKRYKISKEYLFIPFIGYLSSKGTLTYPEGADVNEAKDMTNVIKNGLGKVTLIDILSLSTRRKRDSANYSSQLNKQYKEIWANNKGNKKKIRIENQIYLVNTKILPIINEINTSLKPEQAYKVLKFIKSFPEDDRESVFNSIIGFMPSIRNEFEILSIAPLDNRRNVTINDFYDIENIIIPLAYSNVFVSQDKWIRRLLKDTNLPQKNNCEYFCNLDYFVQFLNNKYLRN